MATEMAQKIADVLTHVGIDLNDANFANTPKRWINFLGSYTRRYDPTEDLGVTFPLAKTITQKNQVYERAMVVQTGIPYAACCAHHLLPVLGTAHVGYIPRDNVVGLSKLSRLVYGITHQSPSLQEDVCDQITDALMHHLGALGAICLVTAEHGCMAARGVEQVGANTRTVTTSLKGAFREIAGPREEFYQMVRHGNI